MKRIIIILTAVLLLFTAKTNAQTICDSISIDTVFVDANFFNISVYNSSQHFIAYPYFTAVMADNPYITLNDSLTIPTFLSIPGDGNNGYTSAVYIDVNIAPASTVPSNTLFTGTLTIQDPNDSTFSCSKAFSFRYGDMLTSLNELQEDMLKIYPNPTSGLFTVSLATENANIESIRLYNISGQLVKQLNNVNSNNSSFNVNELSQGVYIIQVLTDNGVENRKVVIE